MNAPFFRPLIHIYRFLYDLRTTYLSNTCSKFFGRKGFVESEDRMTSFGFASPAEWCKFLVVGSIQIK